MTTQDINEIDDLNDFINISNIKSTQTLTFFKELMTEILTDIIIESDVKNNKLILDADSITNAMKLNERRHTIVTDIELSLDNIFSSYIQSNYNTKMNNVNNVINQLKDKFDNHEIPSNITNDLYLLEAELSKIILSIME
jgi:hypothetical protein